MSMVYDSFLLFGDSITEFCYNSDMENMQGTQFTLGAALSNVYTRKMSIIQRGFSGYTSRWGVKILPKVLEQDSSIKIAYIFFGSNDASSGGLQHVPLEEYKENTKKMLHMLKKKGIKPILIGPAVHNLEYWNSTKPEEAASGNFRTNKAFKAYSDACSALANEEGIPFVNLNAAFTKAGDDSWKNLLGDGLHFNGAGYKVMFDELMKEISNHYPEYSPANMAYKLPNWREISPSGDSLDKFL
ncbi:hypothetical protein TPHA_0E01650 [Tetrapisispora phaffii CBS 4417]|uniref:SGNH hydrolase-type esterase domain-containing protein n=1 Tax=Tetrapisispora phaffii (strain ATCC 24235 / CBS 4417 / NBRC 1672 / NRRL Y-8282 / UCD 70-5) TaxID=1071381 RepID=G8BTN0_TETPH|nr:hypothetical protein TPHA_0E01650 [Tetrapisispora phaffii CBS 4417]CCE63258.1 hypothetical protein TPHA_0E01650 [Tetrapisispora phaffii CBS 4417]